MNKISLLLFAIIFQCAAGESFFGNRIEFNVPKNWKEIHSETTDTIFKKLYLVKELDSGQFVNALIVGYKVPSTIDLTYADNVIARQNVAIVNNIKDGIYWKTYLTSAILNNTKFISMQRIGVKNGLVLQFLIGFPFLQKGNVDIHNDYMLMVDTLAEWGNKFSGIITAKTNIEDYVTDFNMVCKQLRIDKTDIFKANFILAAFPKSKDIKYYHQTK